MPSLSHDDHKRLLKSVDVGSPIAEEDQRLFDARVETPVFGELLRDEIDIVRGTKGSGKTALFRIFTDFVSTMLRKDRNILILKGVESTGDPVFMRFKDQFDQLDEIEFQSFWRIYFLSLVNSQLLETPHHVDLSNADVELRTYRALATKHGFPMPKGHLSGQGLVGWVLSRIPRPKKMRVSGTIEPSTGLPVASVELDDLTAPDPKGETPVFIAQLQEALLAVLAKLDIRVWIMLDRLDEVFARRSSVERLALRGLLRTTLSFRDERLRTKVFLRDDIFDSVTEAEGGFVALTHVLARTSDILRWTKDQLLHLMVNRVCSSEQVRQQYRLDITRLADEPRYRSDVFYRLFPKKVNQGANQSDTMEWLFKHCEDGNGVVTPRDLIDLVNYARRDQLENLRQSPPAQSLFSPAAIRSGHAKMSQGKRTAYLKAEFRHFWPSIERFEGKKAEHDEASLERILGSEWKEVASNLRAIGFFRFNPTSATYSVPFLYRQCMRIRQGRDVRSRKVRSP